MSVIDNVNSFCFRPVECLVTFLPQINDKGDEIEAHSHTPNSNH